MPPKKSQGSPPMDKQMKDYLATLQGAKDCTSMVKRHLTPAIAEKVGGRKTKLGGTLNKCVITGVENLDSSVGILACDSEAYETFKELLMPIVREAHFIPASMPIQHPPAYIGDPEDMPCWADDEPCAKMIVSTRVRCARNIQGFPFPSSMSKQQRVDMETAATKALATLPGELGGKYYSIKSMTDAERNQLIEDHMLFNGTDRFNQSAGVYDDWPHGRGIFLNPPKNFMLWVGEEDHLRIISMEKGGNLKAVYKRWADGVNHLQKELGFVYDKSLGYLGMCPTNIGTGLRASVHMKVPNVSALPNFKQIAKSLGLDIRGVHGEHTESTDGTFDLSNKQRFGLTERELIGMMVRGIRALGYLEADLAAAKK